MIQWSCDPPLNAARSWSVWARQGPARPPNLHSEPNEFRSSHVICNYWMLWSRDSSLVDFAHPKFRLLEARSCCQSFHFRVQWWGTCTRRATLWMARSDVLSPGVSQLCWRPSSGWTESVRAGHDKGISQGLTWADPLDPGWIYSVAIRCYSWILLDISLHFSSFFCVMCTVPAVHGSWGRWQSEWRTNLDANWALRCCPVFAIIQVQNYRKKS